MGDNLSKLPKDIAYACSWPFYLLTSGIEPNYTQIANHCNVWRNFNDIALDWQSVLSIINFYTHKREELSRFHGPHHWNDPDMVGIDKTIVLLKDPFLQLIIGNDKLTTSQERAQMSFWCMWSAPLIMSNDLTKVSAASREILLNRRAIRINQDAAGDMAARVDVVRMFLLMNYLRRTLDQRHSHISQVLDANRGYAGNCCHYVLQSQQGRSAIALRVAVANDVVTVHS